MSRKVFAHFTAPIVIPLQPELREVALYFAVSHRYTLDIPQAEYRATVRERLGVTDDELDSLDCYLSEDYLEVKVFNDRLIVSPDEGLWSEMYAPDMKNLVGFIQRFGLNITLPLILHSVRAESDTTRPIGEELFSEFVVLTDTGTMTYRQTSTTSNQTLRRDQDEREGQGFLTELLRAGKLIEWLPAAEQKFT